MEPRKEYDYLYVICTVALGFFAYVESPCLCVYVSKYTLGRAQLVFNCVMKFMIHICLEINDPNSGQCCQSVPAFL